jgi:hypothetical protein
VTAIFSVRCVGSWALWMVIESSESFLSFRRAEYYNRLLLVNDIPIQLVG